MRRQNEELGAFGIGHSGAGRTAPGAPGARPYNRPGRPALPAFELISTIVHRTPGEDGKFSTRQKPEVIDRYLREARKHRALLILDIQPGRASFLDEVRALRPWLEQPDVSLALDPEWSMKEGEIPGQSIGSTNAADRQRGLRLRCRGWCGSATCPRSSCSCTASPRT